MSLLYGRNYPRAGEFSTMSGWDTWLQCRQCRNHHGRCLWPGRHSAALPRANIRYHSPIMNHRVPEYSGSPFIRFRTWRVWAPQLMGWMCLRVILIWASQTISCMTSRFQVQRMICAFPIQSISHLSIQIIWLFPESVRLCFKFKPAVFWIWYTFSKQKNLHNLVFIELNRLSF